MDLNIALIDVLFVNNRHDVYAHRHLYNMAFLNNSKIYEL